METQVKSVNLRSGRNLKVVRLPPVTEGLLLLHSEKLLVTNRKCGSEE